MAELIHFIVHLLCLILCKTLRKQTAQGLRLYRQLCISILHIIIIAGCQKAGIEYSGFGQAEIVQSLKNFINKLSSGESFPRLNKQTECSWVRLSE